MRRMRLRTAMSLLIAALTCALALLSVVLLFATQMGQIDREEVRTPQDIPPDSAFEQVLLLEHAPLRTGQGGSNDLTVTTSVETGLDNNASVYNGDYLTYTVTLLNNTSSSINNALVLDDLPDDPDGDPILDDIRCDTCGKVNDVIVIPDPLGGTISVTVTQQVSWTVSLPAGQPVELVFSGKVSGQADGTSFSNRAYVSYFMGSEPRVANSNEISTMTRIRIDQPGSPSLSSAATWFSSDMGGTISQDWGDFDRDGDLDLVLGSSIGTTIYRNEEGRLRRFWGNTRLTYGVRWGDFNNDGMLDMVAVGESADGSPASAGTNYVYRFNPTTDNPNNRFSLMNSFVSDFQMVRVEPGDFDNDSNLDLIVSTNSINAPCPVRWYRNGGAPDFFTSSYICVSEEASASIAPGDFNNDGLPDLALGLFESQTTRLLVNSSAPARAADTSPFAPADALIIDPSLLFLPYDFTWGDFDGDGYLDLAAAFPLQREVRVYRNERGSGFSALPPIRTTLFRTPLAVDWGDFNGDGRLELAVADAPPIIYSYVDGAFEPVMSLPDSAVSGQLWSIRGVDHDNDGALDLSISNRDGPTTLFTAFTPFLANTMLAMPSTSTAGSVAWGDVDGDGDLDLLYGAGPATAGAFGSRLYYNQSGTFSSDAVTQFSGFGPHSIGFGDMNGDGDLDIALGTVSENRVYLAGSTAPAWISGDSNDARALAWGDSDYDGDLDLLVANHNAPVALYENSDTSLEPLPVWESNELNEARAVAWGDFNNDFFLDFAVGSAGQPTLVYENNQDNTFSLVWSSPYFSDTRSVAWGDFDGDADLDLAVGNYDGPNVIFENLFTQSPGATFSNTPAWTSDETFRTTSLAWGDWDNDGDLDLAVGNDGQATQVYANLSSQPGLSKLAWVWSSSERNATTGVAWGDMDGDGDLDLAASQQGSGTNGVYLNGYVSPSHLADEFISTMPLANNPSYLSIGRPGITDDGYFYSAAERLSGPLHPTITISYRLYDPDGTREGEGSDVPGNPIVHTYFEYSDNGGGTWQSATPALSSPAPITQTSRLGQPGIFIWDAQRDAVISDDVRFRIRVVLDNHVGRTQRASTIAMSPPFRVSGLTCVWPDDPTIVFGPTNANPGETVSFTGYVAAGSSGLTFAWDFGDNSPVKYGQTTSHVYESDGTYSVRLTVTGEPCPVAGSVETTETVVVGTGTSNHFLYLPIVRSGEEVASTLDTALASAPALPLTADITQVPELQGTTDSLARTVTLEWAPSPAGDLQGYYVYRRDQASREPFERIARLEPDELQYRDQGVTCGLMYYVSAFTTNGESFASRTSYFTPHCQRH